VATPEVVLTHVPRNRLPTNHKSHAAYVRSQVASLAKDDAYFKKVYRHTFVAGKEPDQKALSLDNAMIYWNLLFTAPGRPWVTKSQNWLELWTEFLREKWTRSVNRDMWNMALEFATKTVADETLSFWSEDGAWPSVIDEFVAWCREQGVGRLEGMEID
jgi:DCN1-like protein 1/2